MTIGHTRKKRSVDPKLCFDIYIRVNSSYRIPTILYNEYKIYNQKKGKPFTNQWCWRLVGIYIVEHMVDARKDMEEAWKRDGEILTDQDWYRIVLEKAQYLSKSRFQAFINEHSYLKPYMVTSQ